jgi:phosphoribosylformimino-5-aminoimidazole carboxamide ribotide isomerase
VLRVMYTDISRDGTRGGPNIEALAALVRALPIPVVASGGISTLEFVRAVAATGCEAAIVGKALYEGWLTLSDAIAAANSELRTRNSELSPC